MPDTIHLKKLRQGPREWNAWRVQYPSVIPDLRGAALTVGQRQMGAVNGGPINFKSAFLEDADFRFATLAGADLRDAVLSRADLTEARLDGADLTAADLRGAVLDKVDLQDANLARANLAGASLRDARHLTQAQLSQAMGDPHTVLPDGLTPPPHWLAPADEQEERSSHPISSVDEAGDERASLVDAVVAETLIAWTRGTVLPPPMEFAASPERVPVDPNVKFGDSLLPVQGRVREAETQTTEDVFSSLALPVGVGEPSGAAYAQHRNSLDHRREDSQWLPPPRTRARSPRLAISAGIGLGLAAFGLAWHVMRGPEDARSAIQTTPVLPPVSAQEIATSRPAGEAGPPPTALTSLAPPNSALSPDPDDAATREAPLLAARDAPTTPSHTRELETGALNDVRAPEVDVAAPPPRPAPQAKKRVTSSKPTPVASEPAARSKAKIAAPSAAPKSNRRNAAAEVLSGGLQ